MRKYTIYDIDAAMDAHLDATSEGNREKTQVLIEELYKHDESVEKRIERVCKQVNDDSKVRNALSQMFAKADYEQDQYPLEASFGRTVHSYIAGVNGVKKREAELALERAMEHGVELYLCLPENDEPFEAVLKQQFNLSDE